MPKIEKTFDQAEYTKKFQKENYYRLNVVLPNLSKIMNNGEVK